MRRRMFLNPAYAWNYSLFFYDSADSFDPLFFFKMRFDF